MTSFTTCAFFSSLTFMPIFFKMGTLHRKLWCQPKKNCENEDKPQDPINKMTLQVINERSAGHNQVLIGNDRVFLEK